jgi:hypothetical protein
MSEVGVKEVIGLFSPRADQNGDHIRKMDRNNVIVSEELQTDGRMKGQGGMGGGAKSRPPRFKKGNGTGRLTGGAEERYKGQVTGTAIIPSLGCLRGPTSSLVLDHEAGQRKGDRPLVEAAQPGHLHPKEQNESKKDQSLEKLMRHGGKPTKKVCFITFFHYNTGKMTTIGTIRPQNSAQGETLRLRLAVASRSGSRYTPRNVSK